MENQRTDSEQETRVALITGATSGIGFKTAIELAQRKEHVLLYGRTATSAEAAVERGRAAVPLARVQAVLADLGVMSEARALARGPNGWFQRDTIGALQIRIHFPSTCQSSLHHFTA